jgi:hypothetical protein
MIVASQNQKRPATSVSLMPLMYQRITKIKKVNSQDHAAIERSTKKPRIGPSEENLMKDLL